ncbi:MAG: peroxidase-related enzyme [bacterium]
MSWLPSIPREQADARLASVYDTITSYSKSGRLSNIWQAWGGDAAGLETLHAHYRTLMGDPAPLTPAQADLIGLVVSATNGCTYCVTHSGARLAALVGEPLARSVARDYREANLTARDRVLLDAAVAMTCEPCERTSADLERLREYGFDDASIMRALGIASFYNLVNRMACAMGVKLEDGVTPWEYGTQR